MKPQSGLSSQPRIVVLTMGSTSVWKFTYLCPRLWSIKLWHDAFSVYCLQTQCAQWCIPELRLEDPDNDWRTGVDEHVDWGAVGYQ
jgi:hypothetical protein